MLHSIACPSHPAVGICRPLVAALLLGLLVTSQSAPSATFVAFDVPGANRTEPYSINSAGTITGTYRAAPSTAGSFVRASNGVLTAFAVPGALGTFAFSINSSGTIAGYYNDATTSHGFIRDPGGNFVTFDVPGSSQTSVTSINDAGSITGQWRDSTPGRTAHGFVRFADGTFTTFDVPGGYEPNPFSINTAGAVAGMYWDSTFSRWRSFVREPGGSITSFDPANSQYTQAVGINTAGLITGSYNDAVGSHGFLRGVGGAITSFDVPGTSGGTYPASINVAGLIIGIYDDPSGSQRGFVRDAGGAFATFNGPGAIVTAPLGINATGVITGSFFTADDPIFHGFVYVADVSPTALYRVSLLYDPSKAVNSGATLPVKLQLQDFNGANVSSQGIRLHALSVTKVSTSITGMLQNAGNSNPDNDFRFDGGTYIFNLKTTGLATGAYTLNFTVTGDSFVYSAPFQVK